jgi:hypothetical protein
MMVLLYFCFWGDSPAYEFYVQTFRNTLFRLHGSCKHKLWRWNRQSIFKRLHIKFRRREINPKEIINHSQHGEIFKYKMMILFSGSCGTWTAKRRSCCEKSRILRILMNNPSHRTISPFHCTFVSNCIRSSGRLTFKHCEKIVWFHFFIFSQKIPDASTRHSKWERHNNHKQSYY